MSQNGRNGEGRIVVFTCNWAPYSALEEAGKQGLAYPANVYPIRVMCLGRMEPGVVLKALEKGAAGVLLLGCPPGECHYGSGNEHAEGVYREAQKLARLLGFRDAQLAFDWVAAGDGAGFAEKVRAFSEAVSATADAVGETV